MLGRIYQETAGHYFIAYIFFTPQAMKKKFSMYIWPALLKVLRPCIKGLSMGYMYNVGRRYINAHGSYLSV